jgi:hypothetical protein
MVTNEAKKALAIFDRDPRFEITSERLGQIACLAIQRDLRIEADKKRGHPTGNNSEFDSAAYRARMKKIAAELGISIEEYFAFLVAQLRACGFSGYAAKISQAALLESEVAV